MPPQASQALRRHTRVLLLTLVCFFLPFASTAQTRELRVAAAADLQPVFPALAAAYEHAIGVKLTASFGSSATLTEQLLQGAPEDVFLSADLAHPQRLADAGLGEGAPTPYARGILVLWARKDSPAQPFGPGSSPAATPAVNPAADTHALDTLLRPAVTRIAVANNAHAPYGQAATAALKALLLYDRLQPKLVIGENVAQTAQFALTGNAQAALISLTLANSAPFRAAGSFVRVPAVYPELRQSGIVLKRSPNVEAARAFLQWLTSPETQRRLPALGLEPVR